MKHGVITNIQVPKEYAQREPLLVADDIATMLNVRRSTVYEWARMDYIPHINIGTGVSKPCVRFEKTAVEKWLAAKRKAGRATRVPE